ncbi:Cytochrome P450 99A2-like protein [Drosera capensis]
MIDNMIEQLLMMDSVGVKGMEANRYFLQFLLQYKDNADEQIPLTIPHIKALFLDMLTGGSETTSSTVEFAMAEVLRNTEVTIKN